MSRGLAQGKGLLAGGLRCCRWVSATLRPPARHPPQQTGSPHPLPLLPTGLVCRGAKDYQEWFDFIGLLKDKRFPPVGSPFQMNFPPGPAPGKTAAVCI